MHRFTPTALTVALVLALSACGGSSSSPDNETTDTGGGNPADFSPLSLTDDNAEDVAAFAISFLDLGVDSAQTAEQTRSGSKSSLQSKAEFSFPCDEGGTTTIKGGDDDADIEVGDYFEFTDTNCATEEYDEESDVFYIDTTNGTTRMEVVRVTSDTDVGYTFTLDQTNTTDNGHSGSVKGSGSINIALDGNGGHSSDGSFTVTATYDNKSVTYDPLQFDFVVSGNQYSYEYNASVYGTAVQGSFTIATGPSLTGTIDDESDEDNYPTAGELTITGSNSSINLNADTGNPDTVLLTINDNGTVTSREVDWDSLDDPEPLV